MKLLRPDLDGLAEAAARIHAGEVVAYPTETVYGLAVDPFSETALRTLFAVKGRSDAAAILLIGATMEQLNVAVAEWTPRAQACARVFWPGPLTLVLPRNPALPPALTGGAARVGVRVPGLELARALCEAFGGPLTSTSANRSGEAPLRRLRENALPGVSAGIDVGELPSSMPSTVYAPDEDRVLRPGAIKMEEIYAALQAAEREH